MTNDRSPRRRRVFPDGTPTDIMKLTVTREERDRLLRAADEQGISVSELIVGRTLNPASGATSEEITNLTVEVRLLRESKSALRRDRHVEGKRGDEIDEEIKASTDQDTAVANTLADVARRLSL